MLQKYSPEKDGITQSLLTGFLKCRTFAHLNTQGWTSLRTTPALQFGELAHGVLEDVYTQVRDGRKSIPTDKEIFKLIDNRIGAWEKGLRGQRAGADEVQQLEFNATLLEAVLPGYFKFWGNEDFKQIKWVALEKEFDLKMLGVRVRGKMDGLYEDKTQDLQLFETKTKGRIDEGNISDLLAFDFQTDFYILACKELYGRYPKGARYNIIRRPGEKLGKKEKLSALRERVVARVAKEPETYFIRFRIRKPLKDLKVFEGELQHKINEFMAWTRGELPTYKNETACMGAFGPCRYLKICGTGNYSGFYKRERLFEELAKEAK